MFIKNYNLVGLTNKDFSFENLKDNELEIPYGNHPGAFGFQRKNHIHEGIDIYCKENDIVLSLTNGKVIDINYFTGDVVNSSWWNTTQYIAIEYNDYVIVYGELIVKKNINIGDIILENEELGYITPILKKVKNNRPINMLHLELYNKKLYKEPKEWLDEKPKGLLDPFILIDELFNMDYPSKNDYEFLYKKYIEKDFKFNNYLKLDYKHKSILDLCGGAGYTSQFMLTQKTKEIDYFDLSSIMIDDCLLDSKVNIYNGNVLTDLPEKQYDFIITKQAINYWFKDIKMNYFIKRLKSNGYLIFNTFYVPKTNPNIYKKYIIDNIEYEEYSFLKDDKIYHLQKQGNTIHKTLFNNIPKESFYKKLKKHFKQIDIFEDNNGKSFYYYCQKN